MLDYIFYHDSPRDKFIDYLKKHNIAYAKQEDTMGLVVAVPEDMEESIEKAVEIHYDQLMEDAEELIIDDGGVAEKDVAAITITLDDGKITYASVSPGVINRVLTVITNQELNDLVNSIVSSVLNPDERPICTR